MYEVIKINCRTGEEINYGKYSDYDDVKLITKGYTFNGCFYNRKSSAWMFIVNEIAE